MMDEFDSDFAFAQVGWMRWTYWGRTTRYFWEYEDLDGSPVGGIQMLGVVPNPGNYGTRDKFTVHKIASGNIVYYINGDSVSSTTNPDWVSDEGRFFGETLYSSNQLPGDKYHHVKFESIQVFSNEGDQWIDVNPENNNWKRTHPNSGSSRDSSHFEIWDTQCDQEGNP